jgi:hypothetical protein
VGPSEPFEVALIARTKVAFKLVGSYTYKFLFLKSSKISIFGGISKFHLWADFGKFLPVLGNFG